MSTVRTISIVAALALVAAIFLLANPRALRAQAQQAPHSITTSRCAAFQRFHLDMQPRRQWHRRSRRKNVRSPIRYKSVQPGDSHSRRPHR